ncbi:hypothetical protein WN55_03970 [Dufourea novaeangliae]|uniref:Uncharacterized protein n=1 Tax=Dufourea novaeangliae TaxID=178035 RepID=A0A154PKS8_DUFNO|nr:hypothetical protein WN55_03970 [Dufourea novaeangliae]
MLLPQNTSVDRLESTVHSANITTEKATTTDEICNDAERRISRSFGCGCIGCYSTEHRGNVPMNSTGAGCQKYKESGGSPRTGLPHDRPAKHVSSRDRETLIARFSCSPLPTAS